MAPKTVVITGCSTGIGLETAVLLAGDKEQRFKVFATMRNLAKKEQLEKAAGDNLNKTLFIRELDVTKKESQEAFLKKLKDEAGDVDILVNNAGIGNFGIPEEVAEEEIRSVFETNVFGLIRLTQAVIPGMKAKKWGRIVQISSVAGLAATTFSHIYSSSKFAVEGYSESLAPYLAQFNIGISCVEPGPVGTSFVANMGGFSEAESKRDELTQNLWKKKMESIKKPHFPTQSGKEIADVILKAILAEKPLLRYQTSEFLTKEIAKAKNSDTTGQKIVKYMTEYNGW